MGKTENQSSILEAVEETEDKIPNVESTKVRTLGCSRNDKVQKRVLENGAGYRKRL